jgi:hypothetical protein
LLLLWLRYEQRLILLLLRRLRRLQPVHAAATAEAAATW